MYDPNTKLFFCRNAKVRKYRKCYKKLPDFNPTPVAVFGYQFLCGGGVFLPMKDAVLRVLELIFGRE